MPSLSRRDALTVAAAATAAALLPPDTAAAAPSPVPPDAAERTGGFRLGCQAYSFNRYSAFEAVEKTAQAGGRVIEFYPGQKLSADQPEVRVGPGMDAAAISALKEKLAKHGVRPVAFGVQFLGRDEAANRRTFEWVRAMGIGTITTEPDATAMDLIERLAKEYDVRVAIHNHPRRADNAAYRYWDPEYVRSLVKDRDKRLGACADTGHWVRSGIKPVDALRTLKGRVLHSHLKDLSAFGDRGAHDIPYGSGVSDIPAVLTELRRQGFDGAISIEYEHNWEASVPEIAQCVGFVRGWGAGKR